MSDTLPIKRWTRMEYDRSRSRTSAWSRAASAALLLEISDASLRLDREEKGSLYARAGLGD